jgi:hypothetical protein
MSDFHTTTQTPRHFSTTSTISSESPDHQEPTLHSQMNTATQQARRTSTTSTFSDSSGSEQWLELTPPKSPAADYLPQLAGYPFITPKKPAATQKKLEVPESVWQRKDSAVDFTMPRREAVKPVRNVGRKGYVIAAGGRVLRLLE